MSTRFPEFPEDLQLGSIGTRHVLEDLQALIEDPPSVDLKRTLLVYTMMAEVCELVLCGVQVSKEEGFHLGPEDRRGQEAYTALSNVLDVSEKERTERVIGLLRRSIHAAFEAYAQYQPAILAFESPEERELVLGAVIELCHSAEMGMFELP